MSIHTMFITKETCQKEWIQLGNSMSTNYCYFPDDEKLIIDWKGEQHDFPAKLGDAFSINCYGEFPKVNSLKFPQKTADRLMWIAHIPAEKRFSDIQEYEDFVTNYIKAETEWRGNLFRYEFVNGESFSYLKCSREDCGGYQIAAGYVDTNITKDGIKKFLERHEDMIEKFPKEFQEKLLDGMIDKEHSYSEIEKMETLEEER